MSTTKIKRHKKPKMGIKTKTSDGDGEMFVLPPNLLQKLGINLGKIALTPMCPKEIETRKEKEIMNMQSNDLNNMCAVTPNSASFNETNFKGDPTILETASLMKESVFLSPTFTPTTANISSGECEISDIDKQEEKEIQNIASETMNHESKTDTLFHNKMSQNGSYVPEILCPQKVISSENNNNSLENTVEINLGSIIRNNDYESKQINNSIDCALMKNKEKIYQINSSNFKSNNRINLINASTVKPSEDMNKNIGNVNGNAEQKDDLTENNTDNTKVTSQKSTLHNNEKIKNKSKINIISEEIIGPSKLKELKCLNTPKTNELIPVTINTVITNKKKNVKLELKEKNNAEEKVDDMDTSVSEVNHSGSVNLNSKNAVGTNNNELENVLSVTFGPSKDISNSECSSLSADDVFMGDNSQPTPLQNKTKETSSDSQILDMNETDGNSSLCVYTRSRNKNLDANKIGLPEQTSSKIMNNNNLNTNNKYKCDKKDLCLDIDPEKVGNKMEGEVGVKKYGNRTYKGKNVNSIQGIEINVVVGKSPIKHKSDIVGHDNCDIGETKENKNEKEIVEISKINPDKRLNVDIVKTVETDDNISQRCNNSSSHNSNRTTEIDQQHFNGLINEDNTRTTHSNFENEGNRLNLSTSIDRKKITKCEINDLETKINDNNTNNSHMESIEDNCTKEFSTQDDDDTVFTDAYASPARSDSDMEIEPFSEISGGIWTADDCRLGENNTQKNTMLTDTNLSMENIETKLNNANPNVITSKLSVHGVEKPGGSDEDKDNKRDWRNTKTYQRVKKPKGLATKRVKNKHSSQLPCVSFKSPAEIDLQSISVDISCKTELFCLCKDYGQLSYYVCDGPYEHIHFLQHRDINCKTEDIFGMYDEEKLINFEDSVVADYENISDGVVESEGNHICWNDIEFKQQATEKVVIPEQAYVSEAGTSKKDIHKNEENSNAQPINVQIEVDNMSDKSQVTKESAVVDNGNKTTKVLHNDLLTIQISKETPKKSKAKSLKRKRTSSISSSPTEDGDDGEPKNKKQIKCGVCGKLFHEQSWENHVINVHKFIAWKEGETFDYEDGTLYKKLHQWIKINDNIRCAFCSNVYNKAKKFLSHVQNCVKNKVNNSDDETPLSVISEGKVVKCGVCKEDIANNNWIEHIATSHNYLAWKEEASPLNLDDENAVREHLFSITQKCGSLTCSKCGLKRKYPKKYLDHIKTCTGTRESLDDSKSFIATDTPKKIKVEVSVEYVAPTDGNFTCGVCSESVQESEWIDHVAKAHAYMAWKSNETPLDLNDEEVVRQHLQNIAHENGGLSCSKCGLHRKYVKAYLSHVNTCTAVDLSDINDAGISVSDLLSVKCGVCSEDVSKSEWINHISKKHDYMAWKAGERPLKLKDEDAVREHLTKIAKSAGGLTCSNCGLHRRQANAFLHHVKKCGGKKLGEDSVLDDSNVNDSNVNESNVNDSMNFSYAESTKLENDLESDIPVQCGVCQQKVEPGHWVIHIQNRHNYLAWKVGGTPLNADDSEEVQRHLYSMTKKLGGLTCYKCGLVRKYVKSYLHHMSSCERNDFNLSLVKAEGEGTVQCGVCFEHMDACKFRKHAMAEHYNIAWTANQIPIDLKNPYAVEKYIKEYKLHVKNLVCKVCNISRVSHVGFYAHILTCGKTEEEIDMFQEMCDICNNKYLCIYKSQHMTMHKEAELAKERKLKAIEDKRQEQLRKEMEEPPSGRRRAAQKAKKVIEKYSSNFTHTCQACGFGTDNADEMPDHSCKDDSDHSVKPDSESDDDDLDSVDSNISAEEDDDNHKPAKRKRRYKEPPGCQSKFPKIACPTGTASKYIEKAEDQFYDYHLSSENLYPEWRTCNYSVVPDSDVPKYLPPLEESCYIRYDKGDDWATLGRFEARRDGNKGFSLFTGACVSCVSWCPAPTQRRRHASFLAAATHNSTDVPRYNHHHLDNHPALLQIWECNENKQDSLPELVLGIAHDFGVVWAMSWCPSGTKDIVTEDEQLDADNYKRMGLLAIACSNGSAYILSVPYPSCIRDGDKFMYSLKPVAELRLSNTRQKYQATTICWSTQKGHNFVVVGYADGTVAYYDLTVDSPLLKVQEDDLTVIYPYHDSRHHNMPVTGVDVFPSMECGESFGMLYGGLCSSSITGGKSTSGLSAVRAGGAGGAGGVHSHLAASSALFTPHFPAILLTGDDAIVQQAANLLEACGGGRRAGAARRGAAGPRARLAVSAPHQIRLLSLHPALSEHKKQVIGRLKMVPLEKNKSDRHTNDDLAMKIEPLTYDDAVAKYGVEFVLFSKAQQRQQLLAAPSIKDHFPERFPLADVQSMSFCTSPRYQNRLAIAAHAGFVFIIDV